MSGIIYTEQEGPRVDEYHRRELPGKFWSTCHGCPALRVFDFHYFYCRYLGNHDHPDAWNAGWYRLWGGVVWSEKAPPECYLPTVDEDPESNAPIPRRRDYIRV
jgi:hypothetical protein